MSSAPPVRVFWHGDFHGEGSLARVNRCLVRALVADGRIDVVPCGEPSPRIEDMLGLPARRREDVPADGSARVTLRHRWPPRFLNPSGGHDVHIQPWEFGVPPADWIEQLRARADDVWCYTTHVRDAYLAGGLDPRRVHVVPLGIDPAIYRPDVEPVPIDPPDMCVFLFVGGTTARKNLSATLDAYLATFKRGERVVLLVKDNPGLGVYDPGLNDAVRALAARPDIPAIRYIEEEYGDADMARLYRAATAFVHSYRGEGFSLPALEAMACGVPAIVTAGGATDDFVDASVGYPVPARRELLGTMLQGVALAGEGWWLEIDRAALGAAMRDVFDRRDEARARGAAAAHRAHGAWTWRHAAEQAAGRLLELAATPPVPPGPQPERLAAYARQDAAAGGVSGGMNGMLEELFARLRFADPTFLDMGAGRGLERHSIVFGRFFGWRGVVVESHAGMAAQLRDAFAANDRVRVLHAQPDADTAAAVVRDLAPAVPLDLLALDGTRALLWPILAALRPRVVAIPAANPLAAHLVAEGYASLGSDPERTSAVFVQRALLALTEFPDGG